MAPSLGLATIEQPYPGTTFSLKIFPDTRVRNRADGLAGPPGLNQHLEAHFSRYTNDRRTADGRRLGGGDRESFRGNSSQKFDFARHLDAVARPGSRELRAVKTPTSYDAWRPQNVNKKIETNTKPVFSGPNGPSSSTDHRARKIIKNF